MPSTKKKPSTKNQPLNLHFESTKVVLVTSDDEDRFLTTAREAARACRAAEDQKDWSDTFRNFLGYINMRCSELAGSIEACYVDIGDDGLRVFVATPGEDYDPSISDKLTEIDIDLATRFPTCPADCVQVPSEPHDSLSSFFSVEHSLKVYGNLRNASNKSGRKRSLPQND